MSLKLCIMNLVWISSFIWTARAKCECGYQIKDDRYTNAILTDFSHTPNANDISEDSKNQLNDWEVQEWGTNATTRGTETLLAKQNDASNVWIRDGLLQMRQKAYSDQDEADGDPVSVAEIVTRRNDILYGSFRARYRIIVEKNTNGGAVSGFFFYHVCGVVGRVCLTTKD